MSHAETVPETYDLTAGDVHQTLRSCGHRRLLTDAFARFRAADGFSHARALAYAVSLLLVEGLIAVVGLAVATGSSAFGQAIVDVIEAAVPGPAGQVVTEAVRQAQEAGGQHQYLALWIGLGAALVTATTALGQFERACNRIYGVERDRPSFRKYRRAAALAVTAGAATTLGTMLLVLGRPVAQAIEGQWLEPIWSAARWPLAFVLLTLAATALLRWSPNRRQPLATWLVYGAATSMLLTVVASILLAQFFRWSTTFGDTYGPLAGMIGLLMWGLSLSVAALLGVALTAQLEFVRAQQWRDSPPPADDRQPALR